MSDLRERADFGFIRYACCWEDPRLLDAALRPGPGRRLLSVASAGDNAFSLLASGADVLAVDLNPAQLACVELKREAIRRLEREDCLAFLGLEPACDRAAVYARLAGGLGPAARAFWDGRVPLLERGLVHAGKFEGYFRLFRRWVLPLVHGRRTSLSLLEEKSRAERERFYAERWDTGRWRLLFRLFFGRAAMGRLGRDPELFRHVEGPVGDAVLARVRRALVELPGPDSPFLEYILTGTFRRSLPDYLSAARYGAVRAGLDRLELAHGSLEDVLAAPGPAFDGFNLSDVFEYMDPPAAERLLGQALDRARPGARLAWWEMLAERGLPPGLEPRARSLDGLAAGLFAADRAFFYRGFRVAEARP